MEFGIFHIIVIILAFLVFAWILWFVPKRQVKILSSLSPEEKLKIENETRKILAEILGGAFILTGLVFTWETVRSTAENLRISQEGLRVSQESLRTAQEGQITEQFTRAIEQLGKVDVDGKENNMAIRLGGIRGLERLAEASVKDYWPIMEILTAYIREHARWKAGEGRASGQGEIKPDIKAILDVLGHRSKSYRNGENRPLDLSGVDLRRAEMEQFNFNGANLTFAHMEKSILKGIKFNGAKLNGSHLVNADLEQAELVEADLRAADLSESNLTSAILKKADLSASNLSGANLIGAILKEANLTGAILKEANTDEADFSGAILDNADLTGVNLKKAKNLRRNQIKSAKTDQTTQLPDGL